MTSAGLFRMITRVKQRRHEHHSVVDPEDVVIGTWCFHLGLFRGWDLAP